MIETSFTVDGRRVAATITLPEIAATLLPGVVFVDGSGPSDRHHFGMQPPWFVDAGFAVLTHDKAGCGDTPGDWRDQTLGEREAETRAAVTALASHPAVDAAKVGLWGASQGGWVAPMAACRNPAVAFMILVSASGVSPYEQEAASLVQRMRRAGEPEEHIETAAAVYRMLVQRIQAGEPPGATVEWYESVRHDQRTRFIYPELFADPRLVAFVARIGDHDPLPALRCVTCPVLLVYGDHDDLVPVEESRRVMTETLAVAGHPDVTVEVFAGADHYVLTGPSGSGLGGAHPVAPGYPELMTEWARSRTT